MNEDQYSIILVEIFKTKFVLSYKFSRSLHCEGVFIGSIVQVPLGRSVRFGIVVDFVIDPEAFAKGAGFKIKNISKVLSSDLPVQWIKFIKTLKTLYQCEFSNFYHQALELAKRSEVLKTEPKPRKAKRSKRALKSKINVFKRLALQRSFFDLEVPKKLIDQQKEALNKIFQLVSKTGTFSQILLYGKTGSGKTEVYKEVIKKVLEGGKSVVWLFPEVWLCQRTFQSLKSWFLSNSIKVHMRHCKSTKTEKEALALDLGSSGPILVMGVQMPIFMPIANLGVIIVDEEHESSYLTRALPRINVKQAAVLLAKEFAIPIIFGSATPSVDLVYKVGTGSVELVRMDKRIFSSTVQVVSVDLLKDGPRKQFWISNRLLDEIRSRVSRKEQCIIFINRRGLNRMACCSVCQTPVFCDNCSKALTIHYSTKSASLGVCHECNFRAEISQFCKKCGGGLDFKGVGTKKVAQILQQLLPSLKILRIDSDSPSKGYSKDQLEECEVIIGTQSVAKSIDLPRVSLVVFLMLDLDFNMPFFNSTEQAVQRMLQLSGRNRGRIPGLVIAQTFTKEHFALSVSEDNYFEFCQQEIEMRKSLCLPPVSKRYNVNVSGAHEGDLDLFYNHCQTMLGEFASPEGLDIFRGDFYKKNKLFYCDIFLNGNSFSEIIKFINFAKLKNWCEKNKLNWASWPVF